MQMSYEEREKAYDEDLKRYGYVKQSTINNFALQQEQEKPVKRSGTGTTYLKKIHKDIAEHGFIRNETIDTITGYVPPQPKKEIKKKKKKVKKKREQTSKRCKDSDVYHKIFVEHHGNIKHCMICGSTERLQIHHKDKNHKNNEISNLIMLCYKCHCLAHKGDRIYKLMIKQS